MAEKANTRSDGCYVAYFDDWSGMAVFSSELQALRYATEKQMKVRRVAFGTDLREAVGAAAVAAPTKPATSAGSSRTETISGHPGSTA